MTMMNNAEKIFSLINDSKNICIAGHKAPDGDCIGSVMALYEFIKPLNKNLSIAIDGAVPYNYKQFINEEAMLKEYDNEEFDLLFILDCSDKERLGKFVNIFEHAKTTICIDHHKTNTGYADINIVNPDMSSTGELLYDILKTSGRNLCKVIAENIYIAILTDTGKFSYSNTSSDTHRKTAELMELGVDIAYMDNIIYNSKPANIVKAFIDTVKNMELYYENRFAITGITQDILINNKTQMADIDGVVEFLREIKEVEVSCVLKEYETNNTKVSLRSKNNIDVSDISVKYGGGGHSKAAGFEINDTIENTKQILIETFKEYFK